MNKREIKEGSIQRGDYGLRNDHEWRLLQEAMKRLLYDITAPITGATFSKFEAYVPNGHFQGEYDLVLPDLNIILWRGISYLAGEALIELNKEGSLVAEPASAMVYNIDAKWNDAMRFPRAKGGMVLQPTLTWLPLTFWTPEMRSAMASGGMSNKNRSKFIKRYEDEGRERWTGIKVLEHAQLIKQSESMLLSERALESATPEQRETLGRELLERHLSEEPHAIECLTKKPTEVSNFPIKEQHPEQTSNSTSEEQSELTSQERAKRSTLKKEQIQERMRRAEKGQRASPAGRVVHFQISTERQLAALVVDVEHHGDGICILQVFGVHDKDGFTMTQIRSSYSDRVKHATWEGYGYYPVGTWHYPERKD